MFDVLNPECANAADYVPMSTYYELVGEDADEESPIPEFVNFAMEVFTEHEKGADELFSVFDLFDFDELIPEKPAEDNKEEEYEKDNTDEALLRAFGLM